MAQGLNLHSGGEHVTREALALVPTPACTETWFPIPHSELLGQVTGQLQRSGFSITKEEHALAKAGLRYFGLLQVSNGHNSNEFALTIGVRNSHDMSFPGGLCVGATVFVCSNLSFSGEITL